MSDQKNESGLNYLNATDQNYIEKKTDQNYIEKKLNQNYISKKIKT